MIWYNNRFYLFEGWTTRRDPYFGMVKLQRRGNFPGYVRLRELGTDNVKDIRADLVKLDAVAII